MRNRWASQLRRVNQLANGLRPTLDEAHQKSLPVRVLEYVKDWDALVEQGKGCRGRMVLRGLLLGWVLPGGLC